MATLSPVYLGTIITLGFLTLLTMRQLLAKKIIDNADPYEQPKRAFILEFIICICAAFLIIIYQNRVLHFPLESTLSLLIGCIIAGFFIGLNSSLIKEREIISHAVKAGEYGFRSISIHQLRINSP